MSFEYTSLIPYWLNPDKHKGRIIIWNGYFKPHKHIPTLKARTWQNDSINYSVYRNVDNSAPMIYIHDAESLEIGSDELLRTPERAIAHLIISNSVNISDIQIPSTFKSLRPSRFPYATYIPKIPTKDILTKLETLSYIDQKRYVSMLILSIIVNDYWGRRTLLDILLEYNIYIDEDNIHEWIHEGASHFGYRPYTYDEIMSMHNTHTDIADTITGVFVPYETCTLACDILYSIESQTISISTRPESYKFMQGVWYNNLRIKKRNIESFFL